MKACIEAPWKQGGEKKVLVTRRIPEEGLSLLRKRFDVRLNVKNAPMGRGAIKKALAGCEGLLCQLVDPIDADVIAAGPDLKIIATYAVGYDNIDVRSARGRGIHVAHTPDVLTSATAEMAWSLILSVARRVPEGDALMRRGKFGGWSPLFHLGRGLKGKTLGIVGAGRIGAETARLSRGFRMRVLYWSRRRHPGLEAELNARKTGLKTLLRASDVVSLHLPFAPALRHLLGEPELKLMKPTAILVNTARGALVDEAALARILKAGRIFGAGLDVYEKEPALSPGLKGLSNVVLAPHAGSATGEARSAMARLAAENIAAVLGGRPPLTPVPFKA